MGLSARQLGETGSLLLYLSGKLPINWLSRVPIAYQINVRRRLYTCYDISDEPQAKPCAIIDNYGPELDKLPLRQTE